jgi:hypothetical protein
MSKLAQKKKEAVADWIATKVNRSCPMCGVEPTWLLNETALALPRVDVKSSEIEEDDASTVVQVRCDNCNFVALFQLHPILEAERRG